MTKNPDKARWEEDFELIDNEGLFEEYLEMGESCINYVNVHYVNEMGGGCQNHR